MYRELQTDSKRFFIKLTDLMLTGSSSSYITVEVYCGDSRMIYATLFNSDTSATTTMLTSNSYSYYPACVSRLSNDIDDVSTLVTIL